jgi:hypothetical protein
MMVAAHIKPVAQGDKLACLGGWGGRRQPRQSREDRN